MVRASPSRWPKLELCSSRIPRLGLASPIGLALVDAGQSAWSSCRVVPWRHFSGYLLQMIAVGPWQLAMTFGHPSLVARPWPLVWRVELQWSSSVHFPAPVAVAAPFVGFRALVVVVVVP